MNAVRKFIILILAAACFNAAMSFGTAFASSGTGASQPAGLLEALEIFDGTESEKKTDQEPVTRAEAIYYALKITNLSTTPADSYDFKDVDSQTPYADEIESGLAYGMISPAENYNPYNTVTAAELMKMVICGLGYTKLVSAYGEYPQGYMDLARALGLNSYPGDMRITYDNLDKILSEVLMFNYIEPEGGGDNDLNILYRIFEVYRVDGIMTANAVTELNYASGVDENKVKIDNTIYETDAEMYPQIANYIGYKLSCWVREDDEGFGDIIYFENKSTEVQEIFSEDFVGIDDGEVKYYDDGGRLKTVKIGSSCAVIYNGKAKETAISGNVFDGKWGNVRLIKSNGSAVDTVVITAYENYFASVIDEENVTVYDSTVSNRSICFGDKSKNLVKYAYFRDNSGQTMSFDDITAKSVLSVAANDDYFDVIVTKETVTGVLKSIGEEDGVQVVDIDSNKYDVAPEMEASRIGKLKVGNTYTFYLDAGMRIAACDDAGSENNGTQWAYLIDIFDDVNTDSIGFKILQKSGRVTNFQPASAVTIDGQSYKSGDGAQIQKLFLTDDDIIKSQVIRFSVAEDSKVNMIDTIAVNDGLENENDRVRQICDDSETRIWKQNTQIFGKDFALSQDTVIFIVPSDVNTVADKGKNEQYSVSTSEIWANDSEYSVSAYNSSVYSQIANVVVSSENGGVVSMNDQQYVTVVKNITISYNEDEGETMSALEGFQNNNEISLFMEEGANVISEETYLTVTDDEKALGVPVINVDVGDVITFDMNSSGRISNINLIYDCSEKNYKMPSSSDSKALDVYGKFQTGMIKPYRISDGYITSATDISLAAEDAANPHIITKLSTYRVFEAEIGARKSVTRSSSSQIRDWYSYGEEEDTMVFMQNRYNEGRVIVIYKY